MKHLPHKRHENSPVCNTCNVKSFHSIIIFLISQMHCIPEKHFIAHREASVDNDKIDKKVCPLKNALFLQLAMTNKKYISLMTRYQYKYYC